MSYQHELFVSYKRSRREPPGAIPRWVRNVLIPEVEAHLETYFNPVRVWFDGKIEAGEQWPNSLQEAFASSRAFLMVLSPHYFRSGWCSSEWKSAISRRDDCPATPPIVVPISYKFDSDRDLSEARPQFEADVNATSIRDFSSYSSLVNPETDSEKADSFRESVISLCDGPLRRAIAEAPEYSEDFPKLPTEPLAGDDPSWSYRL